MIRDGQATPQPDGAATAGNDSPGSAKSPLPAVTLPHGGGAIRGMGEKFTANPVRGTGSLSVPIPASPG